MSVLARLRNEREKTLPTEGGFWPATYGGGPKMGVQTLVSQMTWRPRGGEVGVISSQNVYIYISRSSPQQQIEIYS